MTSSPLACVGLAAGTTAELDDLVTRALEESDVMGRPGAVETRRWYDPSGANLTVVSRGDDIVDLVPGFSGQTGADLAELRSFGAFAQADVRQDGVTVTRIACALPQAPYLPRIPVDLTPAAIIALGLDVTVHDDADAFASSDASLLSAAGAGADVRIEDDGEAAGAGDGESGAGESGAELRFGAESLLPYGLFGEPGDSAPTAFVAGTVLVSETHTNSLTGQVFHAMLLRTLGLTATVCLAADEHPDRPPKGAVVAGTCFLVADVPSLWKVQPKPKRRWAKRR